MLPKYLQKKSVVNAYHFLWFILLYMLTTPIFAQETTTPPPPPPPSGGTTVGGISYLSASDIIVNFSHQIPNLMRLVTAFAYVLGMYFIFHGILKLKHFGESRTMMSQEHHLMGPIMFLVVGAMLLYLPTTVQVGLSTFWTNPNPYGYMQYQDQWAQFINVCFMVVQFIGTIAFIRGLVILSHLGGHGGGQSNFRTGLTHIIGGIFCINIYQFVQVVMNTIGIQT